MELAFAFEGKTIKNYKRTNCNNLHDSMKLNDLVVVYECFHFTDNTFLVRKLYVYVEEYYYLSKRKEVKLVRTLTKNNLKELVEDKRLFDSLGITQYYYMLLKEEELQKEKERKDSLVALVKDNKKEIADILNVVIEKEKTKQPNFLSKLFHRGE